MAMLLTLVSTPGDDESCASVASQSGSEVPSVLWAAGTLAGLGSLGIGMSNRRAHRRDRRTAPEVAAELRLSRSPDTENWFVC